MRLSRISSSLALGTALALGVPGGVAAAAPATATQSDYVVVDISEAVVVGDQTFYPTGSIGEDTLVIIPDEEGNLPFGMAPEQIAAVHADLDQGEVAELSPSVALAYGADPEAVALASNVAYGATSTQWGPISTHPTAVISGPGGRVYYKFNANAGTSQRNVGQGLGYYQGYNGGQFGVWSAWYNQGSGTATSNGGAAGGTSWYNVSAFPKFRGMCATSTFCGGYWWY